MRETRANERGEKRLYDFFGRDGKGPVADTPTRRPFNAKAARVSSWKRERGGWINRSTSLNKFE